MSGFLVYEIAIMGLLIAIVIILVIVATYYFMVGLQKKGQEEAINRKREKE